MQKGEKQKTEGSIFPEMEERVSAYWKKHRIFERSIDERPEAKTYVFYDGPPFATGMPHHGHLLQSAIKDAVPRYWTMKGYRIPRKWGWDCHGLPIENLIEKELHLGTKKEIEAYGIGKFNAACREATHTYEKEWGRYIERLGRWVDFEHSYKTMDNSYIESVWWVFSELYGKDLIYEGVRVSLFCPRGSTSLSNQEIAMGNSYVDATDPAVIVKFPVVGKEKTFFLAWTTTPWTLPANTALAVDPDLMYVAADLEETGETVIFAEALQSEVLNQYYPLKSGGVEFEITGRWKGSELEGMRYEPLFSFLVPEGDAYRIVLGDHVTADSGTGIVHTAPAFGEEDFDMMKQHDLPMLETVDDEGKMIDKMGPFSGMKIKDANRPIMEDLDKRGLLYRAEEVTHSVPECWRCQTLLLYKAQPAWFVDVKSIKPQMQKAAEKINWHPEHFKEGRFGKGIASAPDWNFSRTRYWGAPIPVWKGVRTGEMVVIGSMEELKKRAKEGTMPENLDLHRPMIDDVIVLTDSGEEAHRIPEVFDVWFDSGSMPYGAQHYPFENKKSFEKNFPADFIGEAQDQTRGWFYVMHVLSSALFKKPAYKNVIATGIILAEDGKKMSKSLKNYPDPWDVMTDYGADALRYYLLSSPVMEAASLNFSERDLQNIVRGVLNLFWNVKKFYETYSEGVDVNSEKPLSAHILDRWLYARFHKLLGEVTELMDNYELAKASRPFREFIDDLSTWWLRRSRDRMKSENAFEKLDALKTLREVLIELSKMMAPFTPFITERVYLDLGGTKASVHLEKWQKPDTRLIDERLLADMELIREISSSTHETRSTSKIPVRQALAKLVVKFKDADTASRMARQNDLLTVLRDEVNVEEIEIETDGAIEEEWMTELDIEITPELRRKGMRREFVRHVMNQRKDTGMTPQDTIKVHVSEMSDEIKQAIEEERDDLMKTLRADALDFVNEIEGEEVKVAGEKIQIKVEKK